jgi:hypothetical protein
VLGQRGLAEVDSLVEFADGERPLQQVAENQQALLVAERLQQPRRLGGVRVHFLQPVEIRDEGGVADGLSARVGHGSHRWPGGPHSTRVD